MRFTTPLVPGRLVKRYKRFLADVVLESGEEITAHCANSGSMLSLARPGARVLLQKADDPKRKLAWGWKLEEVEGHLVCIDTGHPNAIVAEAIAEGVIHSLAGYASLRREVKYGRNSRIDILLEDEARGRAYVEVKNVTLMREAGLAEFPDAVTSRGAKHLEELADMVAEGHRAVMVYLVNRPNCTRFALAADIDPAYAEGFAAARARGVEIEIWATRVSTQEVVVERAVPLE